MTVPCPGLLGAAGGVSGEERLTGGSQGWFLVPIYSVVNTFSSLGLGFIFSRRGVTVLALWDHRVPAKEKHIH